MNKNKLRKGFTLVELLAVIVILGILAVVTVVGVIPMLQKAKKNAFITEAQAAINGVKNHYVAAQGENRTLTEISSDGATGSEKLEMDGEDVTYCIKLDDAGNINELNYANSAFYIENYTGDINKLKDSDVIVLEEGQTKDMGCNSLIPRVTESNITINGSEVTDLSVGTICSNATGCVINIKKSDGSTETIVPMQYEYHYMQYYECDVNSDDCTWKTMPPDAKMGWGVALTPTARLSTEKIDETMAKNINGKPITSMTYTYYLAQATQVNLSSVDTSNVLQMVGMFSKSNFDTVDLSKFDTKNVSDMSLMFFNSKIKNISGLANFNTSKLTKMSGMFSKFGSTETIININSFDTSKVENMQNLFFNTTAKEIILDKINTSNVSDMGQMFSNTKVENIDISNFDMSKALEIDFMFAGTYAKTINLGKFNLGNKLLTNGIYNGIFFDAFDLEKIYVNNEFSGINAAGVVYWFANNPKLEGGNGTKWKASKREIEYARVDKPGQPGYFTLKN